jgi:UDP-N-acetylglucosamine transferase subunit ALG13
VQLPRKDIAAQTNPGCVPFPRGFFALHPMQGFVTVGSTRFDDLIDTVASEGFLARLSANGFTSLVVQYGNSNLRQSFREGTSHGVKVTAWSFKPDLSEEYLAADLIISHAGS